MPALHAPAEPPLSEGSLRGAFGRFATGVAFVTTELDGSPLGLIVSSFTAVSLDPPLVSFCPARDSLTWRRMRGARHFAISVLDADSGRFARQAARPGADRFAQPLPAPLAVLDCDLEAEHPVGDHWLVVGHVRRAWLSPSQPRPLVYFAGSFGAFTPHETETPCPPLSSP
jgi:3-hydroxy-9,10-secoandrosta-1,3,5(10)-triene-9,17-dione monooxygenase reductase component